MVQYWYWWKCTNIIFKEVADNSGNNNTYGLLSFDNGSSLISIYSWRTINIGGSSTYEFYNKSRGSFLWYANGGTTNRMIFEITQVILVLVLLHKTFQMRD
jgi:hypothetical protein